MGAKTAKAAAVKTDLDVLVVGAGFAGLYAIHKFRELGFRVRAFDRASDVGGTWFWNRYPGARCDIESLYYSYSFSRELERDWKWSSRYAPQPEILAYLNHVADRFDLRRDVSFETGVESATYDERSATWSIVTTKGTFTTRFFVMATGCLSAQQFPNVKGLDTFRGERYHTGDWPRAGVDVSGKRVGVIGTGSSGIQLMPMIAKDAGHLHVFQRTPQYAVPARNQPITPEQMQWANEHYEEIREKIRASVVGIPYPPKDIPAVDDTAAARRRNFEEAWARGGYLMLTCYPDLITNEASNALLGEFAWEQIAARVKDPAVAAKLKPDYPFGAKRLCADSEYFEIFNRDNVTLVDLREDALDSIVAEGVRLASGQVIELDVLIFATGFDAMTGALLAVDIRGRNGVSLREKWKNGPLNYLGLSVAGFPNLFTITGPGSPSVLYNMVPGIEQHLDWVARCVAWLRDHGYESIEARPEEEIAWTQHVDDVAAQTIYPKAKSWYMGANTPGKVVGFMPYAGGGHAYYEVANKVAADGYAKFVLGKATKSEARVAEKA